MYSRTLIWASCGIPLHESSHRQCPDITLFLLNLQTDSFLEVKLWPSDFTKTEFIETGSV